MARAAFNHTGMYLPAVIFPYSAGFFLSKHEDPGVLKWKGTHQPINMVGNTMFYTLVVNDLSRSTLVLATCFLLV